MAEFEVVNEHTIKWTFAEPNFVLLEILGKADRTDTTGQHTFAPSHYMKQFHIKYNADADQQAKDAGFENWVQYYNNRFNVYLNPERPSTQAWIATSGNWSGDVTAVRNPYYYAVDPEGNQLPYIDRIEHIFVENSEIVNLKAIAGDFDFQGRHTNLQNYPLFKESEETGDYRTLVWPNVGGNEFIFIINPTVEGNEPGGPSRSTWKCRVSPGSFHGDKSGRNQRRPVFQLGATAKLGPGTRPPHVPW